MRTWAWRTPLFHRQGGRPACCRDPRCAAIRRVAYVRSGIAAYNDRCVGGSQGSSGMRFDRDWKSIVTQGMRSRALRIALAYAVVATIWILLGSTDRAALRRSADGLARQYLQGRGLRARNRGPAARLAALHLWLARAQPCRAGAHRILAARQRAPLSRGAGRHPGRLPGAGFPVALSLSESGGRAPQPATEQRVARASLHRGLAGHRTDAPACPGCGAAWTSAFRFTRKLRSPFPTAAAAGSTCAGSRCPKASSCCRSSWTEQRRAEIALRSVNESLEQTVAARTEDLRAALLRAENADRVKSAFLATMSPSVRRSIPSSGSRRWCLAAWLDRSTRSSRGSWAWLRAVRAICST